MDVIVAEYKYTREQEAKNAFLIEYDEDFESERQKRFSTHFDQLSGYDETAADGTAGAA